MLKKQILISEMIEEPKKFEHIAKQRADEVNRMIEDVKKDLEGRVNGVPPTHQPITSGLSFYDKIKASAMAVIALFTFGTSGAVAGNFKSDGYVINNDGTHTEVEEVGVDVYVEEPGTHRKVLIGTRNGTMIVPSKNIEDPKIKEIADKINPETSWIREDETKLQQMQQYQQQSPKGPEQKEKTYEEQIVEYYGRLIKQNPNDASLYIQKAKAHVMNKDPPQKEIETLEKALLLKKMFTLDFSNNELVEIHYSLGVSYFTLKNYKKSKEHYEQVKEIDSKHKKVKWAEYTLSQIKSITQEKN